MPPERCAGLHTQPCCSSPRRGTVLPHKGRPGLSLAKRGTRRPTQNLMHTPSILETMTLSTKHRHIFSLTLLDHLLSINNGVTSSSPPTQLTPGSPRTKCRITQLRSVLRYHRRLRTIGILRHYINSFGMVQALTTTNTNTITITMNSRRPSGLVGNLHTC